MCQALQPKLWRAHAAAAALGCQCLAAKTVTCHEGHAKVAEGRSNKEPPSTPPSMGLRSQCWQWNEEESLAETLSLFLRYLGRPCTSCEDLGRGHEGLRWKVRGFLVGILGSPNKAKPSLYFTYHCVSVMVSSILRDLDTVDAVLI